MASAWSTALALRILPENSSSHTLLHPLLPLPAPSLLPVGIAFHSFLAPSFALEIL